MKKLLIALLLVIVVTGCEKEKEMTQIANPIVQYETLEDAKEKIGYGIVAEGLNIVYVCTINNEILEVRTDTLNIRKQKVDDNVNNDISGVYQTYQKVQEIDNVVYCGNDNFSLAYYNIDGYQYSIYSDIELQLEQLTALAKTIR